MTRLLLGAALVLAWLAVTATATTWFVDSSKTGGSQAGTQADPCVSLGCALALSTLSNGDTINGSVCCAE